MSMSLKQSSISSKFATLFPHQYSKMPESRQTLGEIYKVSRLLSDQARSSSDHMHSHREKSEELYVFRKLM
jgi:hypothetical protein